MAMTASLQGARGTRRILNSLSRHKISSVSSPSSSRGLALLSSSKQTEFLKIYISQSCSGRGRRPEHRPAGTPHLPAFCTEVIGWCCAASALFDQSNFSYFLKNFTISALISERSLLIVVDIYLDNSPFASRLTPTTAHSYTPRRNMSSTTMLRSLNIDNINPHVKEAKYAVRGELATRSEEYRAKLAKGAKDLPFDKVISANIGNPQQLDQKPITFFRQVLSLVEYPPLLEKEDVLLNQLGYKTDVIERARWLLKTVGSVGAYSASAGAPGIKESVARFIEGMSDHVSFQTMLLTPELRARRSSRRSQGHLSLGRCFIWCQYAPTYHLLLPENRYPSTHPAISSLHRLSLRLERQMCAILPRRVQELGNGSRSYQGGIQTSYRRRNRCPMYRHHQPRQPYRWQSTSRRRQSCYRFRCSREARGYGR